MKQERYVVRVYRDKDQLAATLTASAFTLIGPAEFYAGVHTQTELVHQNHVLGRCSNVCVLILSQNTSKLLDSLLLECFWQI